MQETYTKFRVNKEQEEVAKKQAIIDETTALVV